MEKQTPSIDWTIAQSDAEWERLQGPPLFGSETATTRRRCLTRYFWGVAALLLLLAGAGDWWWRTTQARAQQAAAEVTATAQQQLEVMAQHDDRPAISSPGDQSGMDWWYQYGRTVSNLRTALLNNAPAAHVDMALPMIELHGEQAVVSIVTTPKNGASAYRQTRFYQHTSTGWLRTEPDVVLWGPERNRETPYFIYHFRQHDAPTVVAVVAQMDTLYRIMRRNFGLPLIPTSEKLVVDVSVTQLPGQASPWFGAPDRISVPSPTLYWAPVELTDADLLAQSIVLLLLEQVLVQASEQHAIGEAWQSILNGLHLWQIWDMDLPLANWRDDVVTWVYHGLPVAGPGHPIVLPDHYAALCAAHKLWMSGPVMMNIPLLCADPEWEDGSLFRGTRIPPTRLSQIALSTPSPHRYGKMPHQGQTVALATLIEYAVATYGRERLPALLAGLGQYESWDTLLPPVFGVSAAEFEAGWQAYLADRYGVPLSLRPLHN